MLRRIAKAVLPPWLIGRIRSWRLRRLVARYRPREVTHTYGAGPLRVWLADPMAQGWYDHDWAELPEVALMRRHRLRPGARVFDLGAHQGVVALMLAREVAPGGSVLAVEASPHNAAAAVRNVELNPGLPVLVRQAAVSDRAGTLSFNEGLNGRIDTVAGAWGRIEVPAVTVDDLAREHGIPDVVFLDVEGAECLALRGAADVLRARPDCFVEVHVGDRLDVLGGSVPEVLRHFPPADYDLWVRAEADAAFRPFTPDDPVTRDRFFLAAIAKPRPA